MLTTSDDWSLYVANVHCMKCHKSVLLGVFDYADDYEGPVVCPECGPVTWVRLERNFVKEIRWMFDSSLLEDLVTPRIPNTLLTTFRGAVDNELTNPGLSAVACRFIIQDALLGKGIADAPPEKMVNIAHSMNPPLISESTFKSCSAAVFLGGKGAHPQESWVDKVGKHEAREALILTRRVLLELFPRSAAVATGISVRGPFTGPKR